uniref:Uncharacterized protein n=1 Tax=viral metagenome TaxID=1070528 RepID=A0A6H2A501_9ZZZZ
MGGASGYNTKFRDFGIPTVGIIVLLAIGNYTHSSGWNIASYIITFGLMFASQTTYFKKKGAEGKWWNWFLVGLANGVALIPYGIIHGQVWEAIIRTLILAIGITIWSEINDDVVWEEMGRGILIILTLGLFFRRKNGEKTDK